MKKYKYPVVMTVAGSDSGGGAGIQADIKTFSALGCFGCSVITAITVQNTVGVTGIHQIPVETVMAQMEAVIRDLKPSSIKIGMIPSANHVKGIAQVLTKYPELPVIVDPVMIATSGDKLMEDNTTQILVSRLFPLATVITPNLDEAATLINSKISTVEEMKKGAKKLLTTGCRSVLLKGGHLSGSQITDIYLDLEGSLLEFEAEKIETNNTHGSGCTLSSAIASCLAKRMEIKEAVGSAINYVHKAIENGTDVKTGEGNGPLNHFFDPEKLIKIKL